MENYNLEATFWSLIQVVNFDYLGICLVGFFIIFVIRNRHAFKEPITMGIEK